MNEAASAVYRRGALAVSSIAVTTALCLGVAPPALADPYDDGDSSEVTDDSGSYDEPAAPAEEPAEPAEEPAAPAEEPAAPAEEPAAPAEEPAAPAEDPVPDDPGPAEAPPADEAPANDAPANEAPANEAPAVPGADDPADGGAPAGPEAAGDPAGPEGAGEPGPDASDPAVEADTPEPDIAEVPQEAFDEAQRADALDIAEPPAASETEVTELTESLESVVSETSTWSSSSTWSSQVTQWNSSWVGYDRWYRPVFTNPYSTPLQLIYFYDNATRVFEVPPMQRAVLTAPDAGVYSFTAVNRDPAGKPVKVSTGSFSGGGYRPAPGQPPPAKPAAPPTFRNVLVQLKYKDGVSKPFRVKTLADLGDDPSVGGHRVLLDDETPAWGTWNKTGGGERLFEVTSTQQLPGISTPSQGPLPGYQVQLTSNQAAPAPAEKKKWVKPLVIVAVAAGVLAVGAVGFFVLSGRRRRTP